MPYRFKCLHFLCIYFFPAFVNLSFLFQYFPFKNLKHMSLKRKCQKNSMRRWILERIVGVSVNFFLNELHQHTFCFLLRENPFIPLKISYQGHEKHFQNQVIIYHSIIRNKVQRKQNAGSSASDFFKVLVILGLKKRHTGLYTLLLPVTS